MGLAHPSVGMPHKVVELLGFKSAVVDVPEEDLAAWRASNSATSVWNGREATESMRALGFQKFVPVVKAGPPNTWTVEADTQLSQPAKIANIYKEEWTAAMAVGAKATYVAAQDFRKALPSMDEQLALLSLGTQAFAA